MGARHHRELDAWRLAHQIRREFIQLLSRDHVKKDFDFCTDTSRAARSACRNIAEGFWRYGHPEFAQFVKVARGSLGELLDSTDEALEKRYIDRALYTRLNELIDRAISASTGLHKYLKGSPTPQRTKDKAPEPKPNNSSRQDEDTM